MGVDAAGVRRRGWMLAALPVALACALAAPALAGATEYVVNGTGDDEDAVPANETCLTAAGDCTLRAAIQESNASLGERDEIVFDVDVFEGQLEDTIVLAEPLPSIADPVRIVGRECETAAAVGGPCTGLEGLPGDPALVVTGAEEALVFGLAISGAETGIDAVDADLLEVQGNWLGVKLDGTAGPNGTAWRSVPGPGGR